MTRNELETLISRHLDGVATAAEVASLSRELEADEPARQLYLNLARLHATLAASEQPVLAEQPEARAERSGVSAERRTLGSVLRIWRRSAEKPLRALTWRPVLAAALAVLVVAGFLTFRQNRVENAPQPAQAVALLKRAVGAQWRDAKQPPAVGQMLAAGWLRLRAGTVQVEFLGGARLLVVGPAELRLDSESTAFLQSGKASAYVPEPARGFTLRVPDAEIVDLGTAFGVAVSARQPTEVHVFDGAVKLARSGATNTPHRLDAGQAAELAQTGIRTVAIRPADFPNAEELARQENDEGRARWVAWRSAVSNLVREQATLLCYTFDGEPAWSRTVTNHAVQAAAESHGALVGTGRTGGRWPGKRALEFRSQGDRLRFTLPDAHSALTLMAWVRVDSLPNDFNSLLMPSRYQRGSIHWMLEREGGLRLTLLNNPRQPLNSPSWDGAVSGPAISGMDFGRWVFLATTYDARTGAVAHYRDGQFIGGGKFNHRLPAVLGPTEFGNWGAGADHPDTAWTRLQKPGQFTRNFIGRLDELVILARALSPEQIALIHDAGRP